jgi:hypothetical protein
LPFQYQFSDDLLAASVRALARLVAVVRHAAKG